MGKDFGRDVFIPLFVHNISCSHANYTVLHYKLRFPTYNP